VWRFLRDCQIPGHDATLATFNRVYNQGKKNHFILLGTGEVKKFDLMYGLHGKDGSKHFAKLISQLDAGSDFEEEDESNEKNELDLA